MKTPWMNTLGIALSTGLFLMTFGAGATVSTPGEDDKAEQITAQAGGDNVAPQHNSEAEVSKDADSLLSSANDPTPESRGDHQDNEAAAGGDSISSTASSDEKQEEDGKPAAQDKSTSTGDLEQETGTVKVDEISAKDTDDADKPDTTQADEDEDVKVNINTATEEELMENLKGIGPSKAKEIIKYRDNNGRFEKIEHLKKVKGIGPATYAAIKSQLVV